MFDLAKDRNFVFKIKNEISLIKLHLSCQGSRLSWQMQWFLNKLLTSSQKTITCSFCQKKFNIMLVKEDFIGRGKSLLCPECQNALWIDVGIFKQTAQYPFSQFFPMENPENQQKPVQK